MLANMKIIASILLSFSLVVVAVGQQHPIDPGQKGHKAHKYNLTLDVSSTNSIQYHHPSLTI